MLSDSHSVSLPRLRRRSQRLRISNGRADHLHHLRLMEASHEWGEHQPGIKLPYQISLVFWQSDAGITRQKQITQSSKRHLFLPLNLRAGELERRSPSMHMAPWWGGGRRVRLLTFLRTEGTLCNHRRLTEGRAEWFYLPVLTKVAESKFSERAPWLFNFRHSQ